MNELGRRGDFSAARLNSLGQQLLTCIRSNRTVLVDYGARHRAGRRVSTSLAESAVNSLVAKRMVKNQQMRWSPSGAHLMLQVRAAMVNGNLRQRLCEHMHSLWPPRPFLPSPRQLSHRLLQWEREACKERPTTKAGLSGGRIVLCGNAKSLSQRGRARQARQLRAVSPNVRPRLGSPLLPYRAF